MKGGQTFPDFKKGQYIKRNFMKCTVQHANILYMFKNLKKWGSQSFFSSFNMFVSAHFVCVNVISVLFLQKSDLLEAVIS